MLLELEKSEVPDHLLGFFEPVQGVRQKDLLEVPSEVVRALKADGWWLRSRMPYLKRNAMPESVRDRPASSVEYVFLLTKQSRYFWDAETVKRANTAGTVDRLRSGPTIPPGGGAKARSVRADGGDRPYADATGRNFRNSDLWFDSRAPGFWDDDGGPAGLLLDEAGDPLALEVNPTPYAGAHFATFPPKLVEPLIRAATSEKGVCPACGAPWKRETTRSLLPTGDRPQARRAREIFRQSGLTDDHLRAVQAVGMADAGKALTTMDGAGKNAVETQRLADEAKAALGGYFREFTMSGATTTGWAPQCACGGDPVPATVLDPFLGSGTTLMVADRLGRNGIGVELNADYAKQAEARIQADSPMFSAVEVDR